MAPPTKLSVATSSVTRLLKEEGSYHKELEQQQARITRTEKEARGENAEFQIRQERRALEETKAVLPNLKMRLNQAISQLQSQVDVAERSAGGPPEEEMVKAKEALALVQTFKPMIS